MDMPAGDILVFLTGQEEIESLSLLLQDKIKLLPKDANSLLVRFPRSTFHFLFNNNNNNNNNNRFIHFMQLYLPNNSLWYSLQLRLIPAKSFSPPISLSLLSLSKALNMSSIQAW